MRRTSKALGGAQSRVIQNSRLRIVAKQRFHFCARSLVKPSMGLRFILRKPLCFSDQELSYAAPQSSY